MQTKLPDVRYFMAVGDFYGISRQINLPACEYGSCMNVEQIFRGIYRALVPIEVFSLMVVGTYQFKKLTFRGVSDFICYAENIRQRIVKKFSIF